MTRFKPNKFLFIQGPGIKDANERTKDYLQEVAISHARGLGNGSKKAPIQRLTWAESKCCLGIICEFLRGFFFKISLFCTERSDNGSSDHRIFNVRTSYVL